MAEVKYQLPKIKDGLGPLTTKKRDELRERLKGYKPGLQSLSIRMAADIYKVYYYRAWQDWGFSSFFNYCSEEHGISRQWAYNLRVIGHLILAKAITPQDVHKKGIQPTLAMLQQAKKDAICKLSLHPKDNEINNIEEKDQNSVETTLGLEAKTIDFTGEEELAKPLFISASRYTQEEFDFMVQVLEIASHFAGINWRQNLGRVLLVLADCFWAEYCSAGPGMATPADAEFNWWKTALERDNWRCQKCGHYWPLHVHHIQRRSEGGMDTLDNLLTLCLKCHGKEHRR